MSDRIFGVIGLLLAGFYAWQATLIQESFIQDPVGPKAFPFIIAVVLAASGIVFVLKPDPAPDWPAVGRIFEIAVTVAVMIAYALALPEAGFVVSTAVAAAFLSWRLGAKPARALAAGIAISVGIYVIFHLVLGLSLAEGPWGF
ncbi:tripartite tricarboxylate transporter TctB family protein [Oricola thermophila]|uniref:Tripartite tricarboxylate transporter TctB family protein n=1 Tax=Oricola thermophila TaxID=2742145 RepID=A0A6N1VKI9_9HYPH|nr:tripartite tricarboxylate transporter TctB family protein [Oricola thermophila]QKV19719.1 tripartite tricarboxylate transporter TctB family protein [Oricola thermophila]